jgi:hypothetical protein
LGSFDLIYHIGVIFVTPPPVQRRILELIGRCLKPGGVAVLSYYAGSMPLLRAGLHRTLRTALDPTQSREENIRRARQRINTIAACLTGSGLQVEVLKQVLQQAFSQSDIMFFHEALNHAWDVLDTPTIEAGLRQHGLQFLNYLNPTGFGALATSRERALAADVLDFASGGGYRYSIFGKPAATAHGLNLRAPRLRWHTRLARVLPPSGYAEPVNYKDVSNNSEVRVERPATQAALDEFAASPSTWAEMLNGVRGRLAAQGVSVDNSIAYLDQAMLSLWNLRLIWPVWQP